MNLKLKCMYFNANGISNRLDDIGAFALLNSVDITFVAETHSLKPVNIKHKFLEIYATKGPNGGIIGGIIGFALSPKKGIKTLKVCKKGFWAILQLDKQILVVSYFPPSCNFPNEYSALLDELEVFSSNWNIPVITVGDMNARHEIFGDHTSSLRGNYLKEKLHLYPLIWQKPELGRFTTSTTSGGKGVTDLIFTSASHENKCSNLIVHETESLGGSDHRPLTWTLSGVDIQPSFRKKWNWMNFIKQECQLKNYQRILQT